MLTVLFYRTSSGREPVKDFIEGQPDAEGAEIVGAIELLEHRGTGLLGTEHFKKLPPHDLYELKARHKKIRFRVFVIIRRSIAWLLHIIKKKDSKVPIEDIRIALNRAKNIPD
ncbi:type II toxin-antitoxin system RelE/ParE family toxin [Candidatus Uhrbacteria bacterium]|nr:type II toxin-antitoxin system RelE/ParE family toxin [Candidatus Uhrbacteria bacterium]